jgi:Ca-activated chloride channel homolog
MAAPLRSGCRLMMSQPIARVLRLVGWCLIGLCAPATVMAEGRAIIVLDASGSMWDLLEGRPKVDIAREALDAVLQAVPEDAALGLLAYGHREKGNCEDIELLVPPAQGRAAAISTAAAFLNFTGKTPLTAAVRAAATALDSTTRPGTVILITDGVDNCGGDPCALGAELEQSGAGFTAHVVGFGLSTAEAAQVSCLATATGGSYVQAQDLASLTLALRDTVLVTDQGPAVAPVLQPDPDAVPAPGPDPDPPVTQDTAPQPLQPNFAPRVMLAANGPVLDESEALQFTLYSQGTTAGPMVFDGINSVVPAGDYQMDTQLGAVTVRQAVTVPVTGLAAPDVVMNAASVILHPKVGATAASEPTAVTTISQADGFSVQTTGVVETWLPAGQYTVTTRLDAVQNAMSLSVTAGQTLEQDIVINAAAVVPQVFYAAGQPVNAAALRLDIVSARAAADGSRRLISTRTGTDPVFHLGAGDYLAVATLGLAVAETPFSIAVVQRTDVPVILDAGVLAVTATGADRISIGLPPDIAGNAPVGAVFATGNVLETLNAGTYQVVAEFGSATTSAMVVITPGGRADVVLSAP